MRLLLSRLRVAACALALLAGGPRVATADPSANPEAVFTGSAEAGTGSAAFRLGYYDNDDNGDGNPFVDEALTVIEPIVLVDFNITDRLSVFSKFSHDWVSSASIERLSEYSNQSGASTDSYYGLDLGAGYELDEDNRVGGFVSGSVEYDYRSIGFGGDYARDFAQKNATVKGAVNAYIDRVDVIRFDGSEPGSEDRISFSTSLGWYQILNRRTHAETGAIFSYQEGFLETAYNPVMIQDSQGNIVDEIGEKLPDTRLRGSLFGRARYSLVPGTALELGGRLYLDSWGIFGVTVEPSVHHWIGESIGFDLGYRFYTQTAADDFDDHFTSRKSHRTQDSDLADFDAHGIHGTVIWQPLETLGLDLDVGYTFREDGIDQLALSIGIRKSFDTRPLRSMIWGR